MCAPVRSDDEDVLPTVEIEEAAPRTVLVRVRGALDDDATARLRTALDREPAQASVLLVDLSRVTLLGRTAVDLLLALHRRCRTEDRHLVLIGTAHPAVNRPLRTQGVLPLFDTRPTLQSALRRPGATPGRPRRP